ncbi:MAG TPA: hypothetical protein VNW52_06325, partial [Burkholderiaceae bacterium]|nr:hypothetical protein [Burkholderiaceae bacterium]
MSHLRVVIAIASLYLCAVAFAQSDARATASKINSQASIDKTEPPAGRIDLIGGEVIIIQPGKPSRPAVVGDGVNQGDLLVTGKDSEAHVTMQDSGFIALRPSTKLQIESYKADGGDEDNGVFKLLVGGMRSITGWIGKFNQRS